MNELSIREAVDVGMCIFFVWSKWNFLGLFKWKMYYVDISRVHICENIQ